MILGVSKDDCDSHKKFVEGKQLTINLIADTNKKINQSYGVWQKKQFMGKEHMGSMRTTFLIAKDGEILRIWENVNPEGHAKEVLEEIKKLNQD